MPSLELEALRTRKEWAEGLFHLVLSIRTEDGDRDLVELRLHLELALLARSGEPVADVELERRLLPRREQNHAVDLSLGRGAEASGRERQCVRTPREADEEEAVAAPLRGVA